MDFGLCLCVIAIIIFLGVAGITALCKNKIFTHNFINTEKSAAKCSFLILKKYSIIDEEHLVQNNEELHVEEDTTVSSSNNGRVYEGTNKSTERMYENVDLNISNKTTNCDSEEYQGVEKIKGNQKYRINKRNMTVCLSEDLYHSTSLSSVCVAGYEATKLSEGIDKPIQYKLLSLLTILPRMISQFSWIFIILCLFGMLYWSNQFVIILGLISIVAYILSCLDIIYYIYISKRTLDNLIELNIITDIEKQESSQILNAIAFINMTNFTHSFKWFVNKILGYRW